MRVLLLPIVVVVLALSTANAAHCVSWRSSETNDRMVVVPLPFLGDPYWLVNDLCQANGLGTPTPEGALATAERLAEDPTRPVGPIFGGGYHGGDDEDGSRSCLFSIWIYYESNGIDGLQRGDSVVDDTCHGMIEADHFVW